jgi:myo-inositol-1(or 4)-monophosphatase
MDKDFWAELKTFCEHLTRQVSERLLADFGRIQAEQKHDGRLVTAADRLADVTIRDAIARRFPAHGILSEEVKHTYHAAEWCWVIDPIDGTTNFTRGIPLWGISLGLLYHGTPVFGFLYFPQVQQTFHGYWLAGTGLTGATGAFCNDVAIQTTTDAPSANHLFNLCARSTQVIQAAAPFPCKIRMMGVASYDYLMVAAGAMIGAVEATPKIWDLAGVWPIIRAAGGEFIFLNEEPVFPLQSGVNYRDRALPSLALSQANLAAQFVPLVACVAS